MKLSLVVIGIMVLLGATPILIGTPKLPLNQGTLVHHHWNELLQNYVNEQGNVNYRGFKKDEMILNKYLITLGDNEPGPGTSKGNRLAYYINLYNAATVKLILEHYPIKSILDIENAFDREWISMGGKTVSLSHIENEILRKMDEPRIHMAINCASYSCPKLLNEAFTSAKLEYQLEKVTREFINDPGRNKIAKDKLELSTIFKWYREDFLADGTVIDFIDPYTEVEISPEATITYLKYDWDLNVIK